MTEITLRWPPSDLSPNARSRTWHKRARATKSYRAECAWSAMAQGLRRIDAYRIDVRYTFRPPDHRRRDFDGMIASIKAAQDGLVDVIGIDDHKFTTTYEIGPPVPGGMVVVEISA